MKKLLYLSFLGLTPNDLGVMKKMDFQTKTLRELGLNVEAVVCTLADYQVGQKFDHLEYEKIDNTSSAVKRIDYFFRKWEKIERIVAARRPDRILIRYPVGQIFMGHFLKRYGAITVTDHQTKELSEMNLFGVSRREKMLNLFERNYGAKWLRKTGGIVGVTQEIVDYELARIGTVKPHKVISNGANVSEINFRPNPDYNGKELNMIFVGGSDHPWHGIERVLDGLAVYKGASPKIQLHLVGDYERLRPLAAKSGIADRVVFHGFLNGRELDEIFARMHVAVGTLALHKKNMRQACPLKVREYAARGIPFVIAYDDVDISPDWPLCLRFPADDSPLDMEKLVDWAGRVLRDNGSSPEVRRYAETRMDWKIKMADLKDFLERMS